MEVRIRTDLDAFSEAEMSVLENHGYYAADRAIRKRVAELAPAGSLEPKPPYPDWIEEERVRRALRDSHKRISWRRILQMMG